LPLDEIIIIEKKTISKDKEETVFGDSNWRTTTTTTKEESETVGVYD
jgi:hypothetical protein|tara:strand:+ start:230 stop:370 length:141 start_codon:yes stop_codon:yes gene_type:complete